MIDDVIHTPYFREQERTLLVNLLRSIDAESVRGYIGEPDATATMNAVVKLRRYLDAYVTADQLMVDFTDD